MLPTKDCRLRACKVGITLSYDNYIFLICDLR